MYRAVALLFLVLVSGCTSNGERIDRLALSGGMTRILVAAKGYRSLIYAKRDARCAAFRDRPDAIPDARCDQGATADRALVVFLEGDGRPWRRGLEPSADPTTGNPLALKLTMQTPHAAAYVTRPCYHNLKHDLNHGLRAARCTPDRWTIARYAEDIVAAISAAVHAASQQSGAHEIILVGYSGGGVLAVLAAERLDNVAAVVTIGANLDTDAWAQHHGYVPLIGSLNPSFSEHDHRWPELHLHGAQDAVVPPSTTAAYFRRYPSARQLIVEDYDHVCCWVEDWPSLWSRITESLEPTRERSSAASR